MTWSIDSADFDGSNDYMRRGAGLTGAADSKSGTFSAWIRLDGGDGSGLRILSANTTLAGATSSVVIARPAGNRFQFICRNSSGGDLLEMVTAATYTAGASFLHVLASWKLDTALARHIYVNDADDTGTVSDFTDGTIDYTVADWAIGAIANGNSKFNGCLAELWFAPGVYLDLSVEANRRKFISDDGKAVFLGTDGSLPTGTAPLVYTHLDDGEAVANFATNRGSGGDFAITGTLETGSTAPEPYIEEEDTPAAGPALLIVGQPRVIVNDGRTVYRGTARFR